jgi:hypothetical protein
MMTFFPPGIDAPTLPSNTSIAPSMFRSLVMTLIAELIAHVFTAASRHS